MESQHYCRQPPDRAAADAGEELKVSGTFFPLFIFRLGPHANRFATTSPKMLHPSR
jgi:hypothetical protein